MHKREIKILTILSVLAGVCLFSSCKETCPAYPRDKTAYMPVGYRGEVQRYQIGDRVHELKVGDFETSKSFKRAICECICHSHGDLMVFDSVSAVRYRQTYYVNGEAFLAVGLESAQGDGYFYIPFTYENIRVEEPEYEILHEWIAPTGATYFDVMFWKEGEDSVWISRDRGLLRFVPAQSSDVATPAWQLL